MPRSNPEASFETAVRHLFRHLDAPHELRRNPLVRRFAEQLDATASPRERNRAFLSQVRHLIATAAERCFREDPPADDSLHAQRQRAIVTDCFLGGKSYQQLASELGISKRQLDRERAAVARRVAMHIQANQSNNESGSPHVLDELRFRLDLADMQAEVGSYDAARREYDRVIDSAADPESRIEALCKRAEVDIEVGEPAQASVTIAKARAILGNYTNPIEPPTLIAARSHVAFLESEIAWANGEFSEAYDLARTSHTLLEDIGLLSDTRAAELLTRIKLKRARWKVNCGRFDEASELLKDVDQIAQRFPEMHSGLRARAIIERGVIQLCSVRPGDSHLGSMEKFAREAARAYDLAYSSKAFKLAVEIGQELTQVSAFESTPEATLDSAKCVLSFARSLNSTRLLCETAISIATSLAMTNAWSAAPIAFSEAERLVRKGSHAWAMLHMAKSTYYARAGNWPQVWSCSEEAYRIARRMNNPRTAGAVLRNQSFAMWKLGKRDEAAERVLGSTNLSERYGSSWSCVKAYELAASITGDIKYTKLAGELRELLKHS